MKLSIKKENINKSAFTHLVAALFPWELLVVQCIQTSFVSKHFIVTVIDVKDGYWKQILKTEIWHGNEKNKKL
jgi:hypothetical protein